MKLSTATSLVLLLAEKSFSNAFITTPSNLNKMQTSPFGLSRDSRSKSVELKMGLDLVTSLRTEWISAAICTNQIPVEAESVLQLGTEDARAVTFVPRSVDELITSSPELNGELSVSCKRQLKQQRERRGTGAVIRYTDQRADDLSETKDESVDVVISLQAADKMRENGLDWKSSVREAARVLKPGGRFIFVEKTEIEGDKYLDIIASVATSRLSAETDEEVNDEEGEEKPETYPTFELIGYDDVDLVIVPHVAGVVTKTADAGLTEAEIEAKKAAEEKARLSELSISAFERGLKKRRKKKKKQGNGMQQEGV
jgi:SAM-dependent methyltransferase